jgi:hypothetical protein
MATSRANKQAMNSFVFENKIKKPRQFPWDIALCCVALFGISSSYI